MLVLGQLWLYLAFKLSGGYLPTLLPTLFSWAFQPFEKHTHTYTHTHSLEHTLHCCLGSPTLSCTLGFPTLEKNNLQFGLSNPFGLQLGLSNPFGLKLGLSNPSLGTASSLERGLSNPSDATQAAPPMQRHFFLLQSFNYHFLSHSAFSSRAAFKVTFFSSIFNSLLAISFDFSGELAFTCKSCLPFFTLMAQAPVL